MHHKLGFAGPVPAGDSVILQLAGPAEIILLSIWGIQLESMGRSSSVDSLLRYGHDSGIGIFRKFPLTFPLTDQMIIMRSTLSGASDRSAWISREIIEIILYVKQMN
jgi:hypothetical protein